MKNSTSSSNISISFSDIENINEKSIENIINGNNLSEIDSILKIHEKEQKKIENEILKNEKKSKKWTKTQLDTVATIKEVEIESKRFELERIQGEFEAELANREADFDSEMREVQSKYGELMIQIQTLEFELSEVKDQRKRNLLNVRSEIANSLKDMESREISHSTQINQLKFVLDELISKNQKELISLEESNNSDYIFIQTEMERIVNNINKIQIDLNKNDEIHNKKLSEANSTIELLKSEIISSKERTKSIKEDLDNTYQKLNNYQNEFLKVEEESKILKEQISYIEDQKKFFKNELNKIDKSIWKSKRTLFLND